MDVIWILIKFFCKSNPKLICIITPFMFSYTNIFTTKFPRLRALGVHDTLVMMDLGTLING